MLCGVVYVRVCVYTHPLHDERAVDVRGRVVVVGRGRQRARGRSARTARRAAAPAPSRAVLRNRAQPRPVAELGTDKRIEPKGMGG